MKVFMALVAILSASFGAIMSTYLKWESEIGPEIIKWIVIVCCVYGLISLGNWMYGNGYSWVFIAVSLRIVIHVLAHKYKGKFK